MSTEQLPRFGECVTVPGPDKTPDDAIRAPGWLSIAELPCADGGVLNLHNVVFVEAGQFLWMDGDTLCVWRFDRTVTRYWGERQAADEGRGA